MKIQRRIQEVSESNSNLYIVFCVFLIFFSGFEKIVTFLIDEIILSFLIEYPIEGRKSEL